MEILNDFFKEFLTHISVVVMVLVLVAGFFAKNYLYALAWPVAVKTLIVSTVFVAAYIITLVVSGSLVRKELPDFLLTFCVTTSLYEVLLKHVLDYLFEKFNKK